MAFLLPLIAVHLALSLSLSVAQPGAPQNVSLSDKDVKKALEVAVTEYNKQDRSLFLSEVSKVLKAQKQVVSGFMYIFKVKMVHTECRKNKKKGVKGPCAPNTDPQLAKPKICNFKVWSQPWLQEAPQVKISCGA